MRERAREAFRHEGLEMCARCGGSGRTVSADRRARSRKGGNASFLRSRRQGAMDMTARGSLGGRPRLPRFISGVLAERDAAPKERRHQLHLLRVPPALMESVR